MRYVFEQLGGIISILDDIGNVLKTPVGMIYTVGIIQLSSTLAFWHLYETWQIFLMGILGGFIMGCGTILFVVRKLSK